MVVQERKIGNTRILINDEAVIKDKEKIAQILKKCAEIVAQYERGRGK